MVSGALIIRPAMTMLVASPFLRVIFDAALLQVSVVDTALAASNTLPGFVLKLGPKIWKYWISRERTCKVNIANVKVDCP